MSISLLFIIHYELAIILTEQIAINTTSKLLIAHCTDEKSMKAKNKLIPYRADKCIYPFVQICFKL